MSLPECPLDEARANAQLLLQRIIEGNASLAPWSSIIDIPLSIDLLISIDGSWGNFHKQVLPTIFCAPERFAQPLENADKVHLILTGPPTSGKSTLIEALLNVAGGIDGRAIRVQTVTTRVPREGEKKPEYQYLSIDEFKERVKEDYFVEWIITEKGYYGTPIQSLQNVLRTDNYGLTISVVEPEGAEHILNWIHREYPNIPVISAFILPEKSIVDIVIDIMQKRPASEHKTRAKEVLEYLQKVGASPFANHIFLNPFEDSGVPMQLLHDVCTYFQHQLLNANFESVGAYRSFSS